MARRDQIGDGATSAAGGDRGRDDCAALRVLSQRPLLRHIASFASGLPFLVGEFAADGAQRFPDAIGRLYPQPRGFLPQLAIICDDLPMLARLRELSRRPEHAKDPRLEFHEVVRCAVLLGRPAALQWLVESGALDLETYPFEGNLVNYAIHFGGGLAMLDWLADHVPHRFLSLRTWQLCFAASRGQLHAIQWLHAHPELCDFTPAVMDAAATGGHLDIVRFLHEHRAEGCTVEAMDMAAANGHLEVVAFLHEHRTEGCTTVAMGCAAAFGHAAVVRFLGEHRKEGPYDRALEDAAGNGHLDAVRALLRWSNRGCLVQARRRAAKAQNTAIAAYLASQTADRVWTCSLKRHEPHGPRRCQRPLDLTNKPANALVRWLFRSQQKDQDAAGVSVVVAR